MAYTTIDKPTDYFNTVLWTGDGTDDRNITGVGFQPDMVWEKKRNEAGSHRIADSVRGATNVLFPDLTNAEASRPNEFQAFISDGFQIGSDSNFNGSGNTHVGWSWKAGTSFTNDASATGIGTIDSTGSVNETAGISIISFTGTGANGTIKHGLSTAPRAMIFKNRDEGAEGWFVYHESIGNTKRLLLNENSVASTSSTFFQDTSPTSSIITLGSNHGCNGPDAMICYAFAEKKGYSKFGSYVGNGSTTSGTYVHLGFKPAMVIFKNTGTANRQWQLLDNKRSSSGGNNVINITISPNNNNDESWWGTNNYADFLSNGFKLRAGYDGVNESGGNYIFMAFAENPFVSSGGIPCTAR